VLECGCEGAGQKGERDDDRWLLNELGRATEGKRGRQGGPGGGWGMEGGNRKKEGAQARRGMAWVVGIGPRRTRAAVLPCNSGGRRGASDAGATADKWGRATAWPGGQRLGAGGQGSVARC
jgi:hypothetical protein